MRAAAIIIKQNSIALIKRHREGMVYYLFPGGTVEENETPKQAVIREVKEELGLDVRVEKLVASVIFEENVQLYYLTTILGGEFGTGDGEEYSNQRNPSDGDYFPVWIHLEELSRKSVRPACVAALVISSVDTNWPSDVQAFRESSS
jgi:8-oxo-dGTP diphosphatase